MQDTDPTPEDAARATLRGHLQTMIAQHIAEAVSARRASGIEQIWLDDEDQYEGVDTVTPQGSQVISSKAQPRAKVPTQSNRSRVFLNITKPKTDNWISRVQEMLLPHDDRPWELGPTPVAEIDEAIENDDQTPVPLADGSTAPAADVAKAAQEKARIAAEKMSTQVEDWFVEGSVYAELRKVIRDAGRVGTGWIKGPVPVVRKDRKWVPSEQGMTVVVKERLAPTSMRKNYWDVFPDPSCGTCHHDGGFMAERDYWTKKTLRNWASTPGVDRTALAEIIKQGPSRVARDDDRSTRQKDGESRTTDSTLWEVWHYYGELDPLELVGSGWAKMSRVRHSDRPSDEEGPGEQEELGDPPEDTPADEIEDLGEGDAEEAGDGLLELAREEVELMSIPVIATVINDRIVRIVMNPGDDGEFPFDCMVAEEIEGQVYGRGIPRKMHTPQRILNAGVRALLENSGLSAGPQVIVAQGIIEPADGDPTITGRKLWTFTPSDEMDDVRKAMAVVNIPSAQKELQAVIDFSMRMADECTNMPAMLQGLMGNAPDTVGGLKIQQSNAASPLKATAKLFDDRITVPHLKRYYAWGMADESVPQEAKGDLQCKARGATALVQREDGAIFLAQSYPLTQDAELRIDKNKWFQEVCKAHRISPESVQYTEQQWAALQEQKAQQEPPKDPRIEAAQIQADARLQAAKMDADRDTLYQEALNAREQQNQAFRERELALTERIKTIELALSEKMSLDDAKTRLTETAMKLRTQVALATSEGTGPQITTPPTEPPQQAPNGMAYQQ